MEFKVVIPARYGASRLPGKPLRDLAGWPLVRHVHARARESGAEVVIATDDARIRDACEGFGAAVCMTAAEHESGTARIAEVVAQRGWDDAAIVVNLQGDEPLMPAANILQVAQNLAAHDCEMATLHKAIDAEAALDPNLVKLVHDSNGFALYFSRAPIPYDRSGAGASYCGHIGIYAYRVGFIETFSGLAPSPLETAESLEQLRALGNGYRIHSEIARAVPGPGIDTEEDLQRVRRIMQAEQA